MNSQQAIQNLLRNRLVESQVKNPGYSLRAFSKKIGMSASATSEILNGKRRVSKTLAERIAKNLLMDPIETQAMLKTFDAASVPDMNRTALRLTADQFEAISDWVHFAILSLVRTANFQSSASFVASRLGISVLHAQTSLKRLTRLGLLELNKDEKYVRRDHSIRTSDDIWNLSLQKAHVQDMEIAKNALRELPTELRDFTALSVPTSPSKLPEAKRLIREFQSQMAHLLESEPGDEVYQMSVYLYPLTKVKSKNQTKTKGETKK